MVKDHSDSEKNTRCRHIGYSFRLAARVLLYAPSHRQDSTYHGLCYISRYHHRRQGQDTMVGTATFVTDEKGRSVSDIVRDRRSIFRLAICYIITVPIMRSAETVIKLKVLCQLKNGAFSSNIVDISIIPITSRYLNNSKRRKEMFYLTTHSSHFNMVIW